MANYTNQLKHYAKRPSHEGAWMLQRRNLDRQRVPETSRRPPRLFARYL